MSRDAEVYGSGCIVSFIFEYMVGTPPLLALYGGSLSWGWLGIRLFMWLITGELSIYPEPTNIVE